MFEIERVSEDRLKTGSELEGKLMPLTEIKAFEHDERASAASLTNSVLSSIRLSD